MHALKRTHFFYDLIMMMDANAGFRHFVFYFKTKNTLKYLISNNNNKKKEEKSNFPTAWRALFIILIFLKLNRNLIK